MVSRFSIHRSQQRSRRSVLGQTLVEYSLLIAMISLVAISTLEELGIHIKGSIATVNCTLTWSQYDLGHTAGVNAAYSEITAMLATNFSNSTGEQKMKAKIMAKQAKLKAQFLSTAK